MTVTNPIIAPILRFARQEDFPAFFRIKSEPGNVYWTGHAEPPDEIQLEKWFLANKDAQGRQIFMAIAGSKSVGYAYVTALGGLRYETALGVSDAVAGHGVGRTVLRQLCQKLTAEHGIGIALEAWIFTENIASIRAHEAAAYVIERDRPTRQLEIPLAAKISDQALWVWRAADTISHTAPNRAP
jgi:L-amino acid N-acyltransferase YncA